MPARRSSAPWDGTRPERWRQVRARRTSAYDLPALEARLVRWLAETTGRIDRD